MSIKEWIGYSVVCDEPGCETSTQDVSEHAAWGDTGQALDNWQDYDCQVVWNKGGGTVLATYCDTHRKPECAGCGEAGDVSERPDGDNWCDTCWAREEEVRE